VKLPGSTEGVLLVRDEHTFDGSSQRVPNEAQALVRAYLRTAKLEPVARSRTVRRPTILKDAAGAEFAEVVDDEVQVVEGRKVTAGYRELEVELGDAAQPDTLDKVLARLHEAGAKEAEGQASKYRQALGERELSFGPPERLWPGSLRRLASPRPLPAGPGWAADVWWPRAGCGRARGPG
jgi:hypothetical protein